MGLRENRGHFTVKKVKLSSRNQEGKNGESRGKNKEVKKTYKIETTQS